MSKAYTVVAILEAKSDKIPQLKQALVDVIEPSRAETTCLEYRLHQCVDEPTKFFFYENWSSKAEHQQQFEKPYIASLVEKISDLLASPYQILTAEEIDINCMA